jgi:hypothetical protein
MIVQKLTALAYTIAFAAATAAQAQEVIRETQTTVAPAAAAAAGETRLVSQIIGSTVRLQGNNNFGAVTDIALDRTGNLAYLVVSNSGRYVMMPWNAANVNWGNRFVNYNVAPAALQPLYFEKGAWPNIYDPAYTAQVRKVFPDGAVRREVLRPVPGDVPVPGPGAVPAPAPGVVKERVTPSGKVKIEERAK